MINRVTLVGRLGADPEVRTLENGAMVAKFSLATSEKYKDRSGEWQEETQWHDVVVWRLLAERAQQYLKKGSLVYMDGKLTHRKWQDKDGNNRKTTEVVGSYFRMLSQREGGGSSNYFPSEETAPRTSAPPPVQEATTVPASSGNDDDDLPF